MVFTRSQKRNNDDIDLQVNDGFANVNLIKKKKKSVGDSSGSNSQQNSGSGSGNGSGEIMYIDNSTNDSEYFPENYDNESTITITSTVMTDEITHEITDEITEVIDREIEELKDLIKSKRQTNEEKKQEIPNKILNIKLNQSQIQDIIQESIKQLIKRYDDEDMEFIKEKPDKNSQNEYDKFVNIMDSIYSGDFFQRIPLEDKIKKLKETIPTEEMSKLNEELEKIKNNYKTNAPSVIDILKLNVPLQQKQKLLEKIYMYSNSEILTNEYNSSLKHLMLNTSNNLEPHYIELEQQILNLVDCDKYTDNYKHKILKSGMSFENKVIAYKKFEIMQTYEDSDSTEYAKHKTWMDGLLSVPFGNYIKTPSINELNNQELKEYVNNVREILDKRLSFMENPKDQIINIITQMIRNPDFPLNAIGIYGPKGLGKTSIVKSIADALNRPYRTISLGGESDSSVLNGHGFTYVGSNPGRIIEILKETQTMNPIVLIDELDKISGSVHGQEIIGSLIHLTDYTTNNKYNYDRYYSGIEFDLSKALFIFTYNDASKIDKILSDRLYKIKVDNYNIQQKLEITKKHIIPNILDNYKFTTNEVIFPDDTVSHIVNISKGSDGMREIKRNIEVIVSRINTLLLTKDTENIIKLKYKSLYEYYKNLPITIKKEHVDILLTDSVCSDNISSDIPFGMYI